MEKISGIYKLNFDTIDLPYIGQSVDILRRYKDHKKALIAKSHRNKYMQECYLLTGELPGLDILEIVDNVYLLNSREDYWINKLNSVTVGLNILAPGKGLEGVHNPNSKHSKDTYINILFLLVYTNSTHKEIAKSMKVTDSVVEGISALDSHSWLKIDYPEEYSILEKRFNNRQDYTNRITRNLKFIGGPLPSFIHEDGTIIKEVNNLSAFSREYNLSQPKLSELKNGNRKYHKGWRLLENDIDFI